MENEIASEERTTNEVESHGSSTIGRDQTPSIESSQKATKYLIFTLNSEYFAIPLLTVKELIGLTEITSVPDSPDFFKGIFNLRGNIISVIDLRCKMRLKESDYSPLKTSIIITEVNGVTVGAIVDEINEVAGYTEKDINRNVNITTTNRVNKEVMMGIAKKSDDRLVILLDISKLISPKELGFISKAGSF